MLAELSLSGKKYRADLAAPIDISIPLRDGEPTVNCFWAPPVDIEPVRMGSFVGSVAEGGPVNFVNIKLNPHGNGTHTECVGHISREKFSVNRTLRRFHFLAKLISVSPERAADGDLVIFKNQLEKLVGPGECEAIIIRTLPNRPEKLSAKHSGTNPPYFHPEAIGFLVGCGIQHLLTDLPSVDREEDGGRLAAHKAWWKYPGPWVREQATITELVFVGDETRDGLYLLELQVAPIEVDASPSRPVIYRLTEQGLG